MANLHGRHGEGLRFLQDFAAGCQPRQRGNQRRPIEPQFRMAVEPVFPLPGLVASRTRCLRSEGHAVSSGRR
eukprot:3930334-Lingulodinium_polyedra.AAC.1